MNVHRERLRNMVGEINRILGPIAAAQVYSAAEEIERLEAKLEGVELDAKEWKKIAEGYQNALNDYKNKGG